MENSRSSENTQHRRSNSTRRQSVHRKRSFCEHCNHSREVKEDNDDIKEFQCMQRKHFGHSHNCFRTPTLKHHQSHKKYSITELHSISSVDQEVFNSREDRREKPVSSRKTSNELRKGQNSNGQVIHDEENIHAVKRLGFSNADEDILNPPRPNNHAIDRPKSRKSSKEEEAINKIEYEKNYGRNCPKQEDLCHSRIQKSRLSSSSSPRDPVISSLPLDEEAPITRLNRRHSLLSHSSVKRLFNWKARSGVGDRRVSEPNNYINHSNEYFSFSTSEEDNNQLGPEEVVSSSSSISEPYNTTMQCYCGHNSCHLCNLLLNLQITNTGVE